MMFAPLGNLPVGRGNRVFAVVSFHEDRAVLRLHLSGPNGSRAGTGPKPFPRALRFLYPAYDRGPGRRALTLQIPLPHISWAVYYRYRRIPGSLRAMHASYSAWTRIVAAARARENQRAHRKAVA